MDIQQFVKATLEQIANGVNVSFKDDKNTLKFYLSSKVGFDLAVTTTNESASETSGSGKIGIKVVGINASKAGTKSEKSETVSRVQFSVDTKAAKADSFNFISGC
ncbi:hypothetical protein IJJ36_04105 [Candidatus Saccharibacteria bacterium]|nr:hypothetical protein [Candidatus Saccharibacteria bacterium]